MNRDNGITILADVWIHYPSLFQSILGRLWTWIANPIGGHSAVTSSLLRGLKTQHIVYNYNPRFSKNYYSTVIVLSGIDILKRAIQLKHAGRITKIIAGPNLVVLPNEMGSILADPAIDAVIVPSQWVKSLYQVVEPRLISNVEIWPAGVNSDYWRPTYFERSNQFLIYSKNHSSSLLTNVKKCLKRLSIPYQVIVYGSYSRSRYKHLLNKSAAMIYLSKTESQGIALAEAWSMNIPTLVWSSTESHFDKYEVKEISSCPYISTMTGSKWSTMHDLEKLLLSYNRNLYQPRKWIINNMTDEVTAGRMIKIIHSLDE